MTENKESLTQKIAANDTFSQAVAIGLFEGYVFGGVTLGVVAGIKVYDVFKK